MTPYVVRRSGGVLSFLSMWFRNNFRGFWQFLQSIPVFNTILNQFYIAYSLAAFQETVPRIPKYTLINDYPSMDVLYDESRTTYSRLLPRAKKFNAGLPSVDLAATAFLRTRFTPDTNRNFSLLISFYAQWFTHQFFNTNVVGNDGLTTNQPLGINLGQLYGSTTQHEEKYRLFKGGLLKSTTRKGQEFPEILPTDEESFTAGDEYFNMPIPRANVVPGFAAIHVLFFRRHNYVCRELAAWAQANGIEMDDERLYQTAKVIVVFNMLRITMHDYVARALQSSYLQIRFDQKVKDSFMWKVFGPSKFYPSNAIQIEFDFLYRWHQFYPNTVKVMRELPLDDADALEKVTPDVMKHSTVDLNFPSDDHKVPDEKWNSVNWLSNAEDGLERVLFSASSQRAGKLELLNTNEWLVKNVVKAGIQRSRDFEIASYNDYREYFGFPRMETFEQISSNPEIQQRLKDVYGHPDQIEFYAGIFAEDKDFGGTHGPFLATIGVAMTFTGIFSSRLFETDRINEDFLTSRGMQLAYEVEYLSDLTRLHTRLGNARIRFTMPDGAPIYDD